MKKSKGNTSPFPWWEKRRQAMNRKYGFSEPQYIPVGNKNDKFKASSTPIQWKEPVRDGEDSVQLSAQQEYVLDLIRQGKNVFYTGNAGTGKTTLLREIQKCAPEGTFITALTGVAAVQAGGTTLHSFAGIGLGNGTKENLYSIVLSGQKSKNWRSANVLIIDEVSMLDGKLFDKLEYIARKIRQCEKPFGGIQLVLCGDFFQLPPIQKVGETSVNYCFQSSSWAKVLDYSLELTQIYRQSDPKLIKLLNEVRYQHVSADSLDLLKFLNRPLSCTDIEPTKLYSHNKSVNDINNRKLYSLKGEEKVYFASDHGQSPYKENLGKYVIAMEKLVLKKGAQVMLLKNLTEELINGSRGVVEDFDEEGWPRVKFTDGTLKTIRVEDWNLENSSGIVLARRSQVPLKLAWAMTIHKSQGMSIDLLQVDLKHVFSQGQAYVALSRARTIEGLQVLTFDETKFTTSDAVIKFYREKIQKAPGQLVAEPCEASSSSSALQTISPKDLIKTPSKRRRSDEKGDDSTKKRFRSRSGTSPVDFNASNTNHELSYSSQESSFSSSQGESSQMVSSSSSSHTPCVKKGFQKASELYSDPPSQNKELSLPFLIEEATDEECLLASPTPSSQLVVKRRRPTQSNLFDNFIHQPKADEIKSSSNFDLTANGGEDGSSWNTCSGGPSWNPDSGGKQKSPLPSCTKANQKVNKSNSKSTRQRSRAAKAAPSHTFSSENDKGSSKFEARVKRQREKSKRKSSILFDALKSGESKDAQEVENGPSLDNQTASFDQRKSKSCKKSTNKTLAIQDLRSTDLQMTGNKDLSNEITSNISSSIKEEICLDSDNELDTSAVTTGDASESPSANESYLHLADEQFSSSSIGVACERSRKKSKIRCSKLFEALKEDGDGEDASVVPYYADKNLDFDSSVHRSASIKLHRLCENIAKETSVEPERMEGVICAGYGTNTLHKTKTGSVFKLAASATDNGTKIKDSVTQTDSRRSSSKSLGVLEEEASTQTDAFPQNRCSGCLGVQEDPSSDNPDTSSRLYSTSSLDRYPFSQVDIRPRNYSFSNSCGLEGMYLEFRIPSMSFMIAELNKMLSIMLCLAAVMFGVSIQIFWKQLDD